MIFIHDKNDDNSLFFSFLFFFSVTLSYIISLFFSFFSFFVWDANFKKFTINFILIFYMITKFQNK